MSSKAGLSVCLCLEDLDSCVCGILINELGSGKLFGSDQIFSLELQSSDDKYKLEDLRLEVQDCAFPVIEELSSHQTLTNMEHTPDVVLVILSSRNLPYTTGTPTTEQFQRLLSLVNYISNLSNMLSTLKLDTVKIIIAGDLALTAASVMSYKLNKLSANQLMAIDFQQNQRNESKIAKTRRCYKIAKSICETVKQWWSGIQTLASTYLGIKHTDPSQRARMCQGSGYFFSTLVSLTGPMKFVSKSGLHIDHNHIAEVKATSDHAIRILQEISDPVSANDEDGSILTLAHL